ncbi:MAG: hypothetical protein A3G24_28915 [Betaproteobacteria bacterium RIFCSPLOWO2_12_FULL_62_13]|nr:MAG: hypothetical protein A3G24_28915 [Betaproteobacteria bacterium RIFCSPLOWO2_12_FULL_62_13]
MSTRLPFCFRLLLTGLPVLLATLPPALAQSGYPTRTIRIIVPGSPGAGFDTVARLMAPGLSERLGRQVVVENRAGAGTIIGTEIVAKASPDGYTLLMCAIAFAINPALYRKLPYDALRDFTPITQTAFVPNLMAVHPSVPVKSVKEMIALAKARPGEILFASGGRGASSHVTMELFASMARIRMTHVPYKGTTPGIIDLLAGQVAIMAASMAATIGHVRAGKLRALGVTSARRVSAAPDIPAIAEAGLPGYESVNWFGLLAPAGTPQEVIARLHQEAVAVLRAPSIKERLAADGTEAIGTAPEEFAAFIKAETVKWTPLLKAAGITLE